MNKFKRLVAAFSFDNFVMILNQVVVHQLADIGLVFDDENLVCAISHN